MVIYSLRPILCNAKAIILHMKQYNTLLRIDKTMAQDPIEACSPITSGSKTATNHPGPGSNQPLSPGARSNPSGPAFGRRVDQEEPGDRERERGDRRR
jgi:hypothetical protein